jgi:hypothetical protein
LDENQNYENALEGVVTSAYMGISRKWTCNARFFTAT